MSSSSLSNPTLQADFAWRKWHTLISDASDSSRPIYVVHYRPFAMSSNLIFKSAADDNTIGTGTLHAVSINAHYDLHGRKGTIKALKRWKTAYTYLSSAYADGESLATMTWTSNSDFKTWDFICLDSQQMPVAKFSANLWALKRIGNIEFLGPKASSPAVRDEIVVTGLTLVYCMILRTSSLLSFFGACVARPGPIKSADAATSGNDITQGETAKSQQTSINKED
ncbi:MAG: hypothetical protein Q9218_003335 [Villophora microphyllina]